MIYKRFYIRIILQILLLTASLFLLVRAFQGPYLWVTSINLLIIVAFQILYLIWYINKVNRDLARFFEAFRYQDATLTFNYQNKHARFTPLYKEFDRVLAEFRKLRGEQEKDRFFYLSALNHVGIGLIVINEGGDVRFSNQTIHKLIGAGELSKIENLNKLKPGFAELILNMTPNRKELVRVVAMGEMVQLSLRSIEFRMEGELFRVISFQDIRYEIEQREVEAWQKLIRILTHEIMNSMSPITLTSSGIINMFEKEGKPIEANKIDNDLIDNILVGLKAIRKRSKGLAGFVENYRSITHLPPPNYSTFSINGLFEHIEVLLADEWLTNQIAFAKLIVPHELQLMADEKLIEQVLLNLLRNAIQALADCKEKQIKITAKRNADNTFISVADNGKGIPTDIIDTIFVPFFTTKTNGSGIGLTLSREIMKLHGGYIKVISEPGETVFTLVF